MVGAWIKGLLIPLVWPHVTREIKHAPGACRRSAEPLIGNVRQALAASRAASANSAWGPARSSGGTPRLAQDRQGWPTGG